MPNTKTRKIDWENLSLTPVVDEAEISSAFTHGNRNVITATLAEHFRGLEVGKVVKHNFSLRGQAKLMQAYVARVAEILNWGRLPYGKNGRTRCAYRSKIVMAEPMADDGKCALYVQRLEATV